MLIERLQDIEKDIERRQAYPSDHDIWDLMHADLFMRRLMQLLCDKVEEQHRWMAFDKVVKTD